MRRNTKNRSKWELFRNTNWVRFMKKFKETKFKKSTHRFIALKFTIKI